MRIISRRKLREFGTDHPESMPALDRRYRVVRLAQWRTFADLRATYASADRVGDYVVFNVGGNKGSPHETDDKAR